MWSETAREQVRKLVHLPGGLLVPLLLWLFGYRGAVALAVYVTAYLGIGGLLASRRGIRLPVVAAGIAVTRRVRERFPTAAFEFPLAVLFVGLVFPIPVLVVAIATLAVGDAAAALVGRPWGKARLPWNPTKSWLGTVAGIVFGATAAAVFFVIGTRVEPIMGQGSPTSDPTVFLVAFAAGGTIAVLAGAYVLTRLGLPRHADAPWSWTVSAIAICAATGALVLKLPRGVLDGPLLGSAFPAATLVTAAAAAVVAMAAESFLRGHDNLAIPTVTATLLYALAWTFPAA